MTSKTLYALPPISLRFRTEASAFAWLAAVRWPEARFHCPRCGATKAMLRTKRMAVQCRVCARIVSVRVGTVMQGSRQSLATWVAAAAIVSERGTELVAARLQRTLGIGRYEVAYNTLRKLIGVLTAYEGEALRGNVTVEEYGLDVGHDVLVAVETLDGVGGRVRARVVSTTDSAERQEALRAMVDRHVATITFGPRTRHRLAELRSGKKRKGGSKGRQPPEVVPVLRVIHGLRPLREKGVSLADARERLNEFCFRQEFCDRPDAAVLELLGVRPDPQREARQAPRRQ